jgi:hypothetical protein
MVDAKPLLRLSDSHWHCSPQRPQSGLFPVQRIFNPLLSVDILDHGPCTAA